MIALLGAALVIGIAVVWWGTQAQIRSEVRDASQDEIERNDRLALAHEEQVRLVLRLLDESILSITADPEVMGRLMAGNASLPPHLAMRGIHVGLADTQGRLLAGGAGFSPDWALRLVQAHRLLSPFSGHVQPPMLATAESLSWTTTLSRTVRDPNGRVLGVIFVRLDPQVFLDFFQKASLGPSDVIVVVGNQDGLVRARRSGEQYSFSGDHGDTELVRAAAQQPAGHFVARSPIDGHQRFYSYRTLPEYGLVAAVGTSYDRVMRPINERADLYNLAAAGSTVLLLLGSLALALALRRRDQAVTRLRESEIRFRALTHMAADWYWETDAAHRFTEIVQAPRHAVIHLDIPRGLRRWELTGIQGDAAFWEQHKQEMDSHARFVDFEMRRVDTEGRMRVLLLSGEPVFDDAGSFQGYRGVGHDVTAQHEAQAARRASEARLAGIIESAMDAIITVDSQQRIVVFNAAAAEMFRCTPEQALGQPLDILLPHRYRQNHAGQMRHFSQHGSTPRAMGRGRHIWALRADGQEFPADASISHIEIDGMPLYSVVLRDITKRLAAEGALRDSEESYRLLFENNVDGILLCDAQGAVSRANPAARRLLARGDADICGQDLAGLLGEEAPLQAALAECRTAGHARTKLTLPRAGGQAIHLEMSLTDYVDSAGGSRLSVILHDVSERHTAQAAQEALASQLRQSQKMEALGSIAGGIAHDFNNVIAAILGNVRLAQGALGSRESAESYIQEIASAGYRARELVKRIMAFSRKQPAVFVRQPLGPIVREAVALMRATLPSGVRIELRGDDLSAEVQADATQIHQVVMNLGTNAWQAMGQRSGHIAITLQPLPATRQVRLSFEDNGIGMDAATQARIFEPFFTTKPDGEGTGLGLPVVQGIVQAHLGEISITSAPGQGCRFDILLPLAETDDTQDARGDDGGAAEGEAVNAGARAAAPASGAGHHVVYVDDYEAMVAMVGAVLEGQGYRVRGFDNSVDAAAYLGDRSQQVDLLITDYNMPEMSGLDLTRAARALRPDLPVIVASGHLSADLRAGAAEAGVDCLFDKPDGIDELCLRIAQVLQARQSA